MMRGDIIEISAGYHPNMEVVFKGYVSRVDSKIPVTILCEDEMFQLKQQKSPSFTLEDNVSTLSEVLSKSGISTEYTTEQISSNLGKFRTQRKPSKAFVLQALRNAYGFYSYFVDKILYVGLASWGKGKEHTIVFERDVYDTELQFLRADDVKMQIKGILVKGDNSRVEKEYGDVDGDVRTVYHYGEKEADLDATCERFLKRAKYTGYYGTFTTRLEPVMTHGDVVNMQSYKDTSRNGKYLVKSVVLSIGVKGGKQKVELERQLSVNDNETVTSKFE